MQSILNPIKHELMQVCGLAPMGLPELQAAAAAPLASPHLPSLYTGVLKCMLLDQARSRRLKSLSEGLSGTISKIISCFCFKFV